MAFLNRVGSILKQTASKHVNFQLAGSNASLFQAIRSMSSSKLFVGGLSYGTDEMSLREAFSQYGEVIEAKVILDRETGRSRGFGFITYTSTDGASSAIQGFDGQELHGRKIRVNYATEKPRGGFGGGYGGQGNFGYGGQGGGSYGGQGGSYSGYGSGNQYPSSGESGYGRGNSYGESGYGGNDGSVQGGGNYGGGGNNYGNQTSFSSLLNNEPADGTYGESQGPVGGLQDGTDAGNDEVGDDTLEGSEKEGDDEPNDYANTKGL